VDELAGLATGRQPRRGVGLKPLAGQELPAVEQFRFE
jgi:hypothetical protein